MRINYTFSLFFILYFAISSDAQIFAPEENFFYEENASVINPAFIAIDEESQISLHTKRRIFESETTVETYILNGYKQFGKNISVGARLYYDRQDYLANSGFVINSSYQILIDKKRSADYIMHLGLGFKGEFLDFSVDGVRPVEPQKIDPVLIGNKIFNPYVSIGGALELGKLRGGVSATNIKLANNIEEVNSIEPLRTRYTFFTNYLWEINNNFDLIPGFLVILTTDSYFRADFSLRGRYKIDDKFRLEVGLNTQSVEIEDEQTTIFKPLISFGLNQFDFIYSYETSDAVGFGPGHSLGVKYVFERKRNGYRR